MAVDRGASVEVTAFDWVPDFAKGLVRDLRVRWALEEAGVDYRERLIDPRGQKPEGYLLEQPFGQVPAYRDGDVQLFESGAIVIHIGETSEALLPSDPAGRARAIAWVTAALNSVEPAVAHLIEVEIFHEGEDWTTARRPQAIEAVRRRIRRVADWLGERDYLEPDGFTAGDLMMTSVLRILRTTDLVAERPNLAAYQARCEARPAFARALAAQLAAFGQTWVAA